MAQAEIDYESLPDSIPFSNHMLAGALAGIFEHSLMYPIDSIKTRIQTSNGSINRSLTESIKKISSTEGLRSLWKGISAVVVGAGPAHAVYFGVYEHFKSTLINTHIRLNYYGMVDWLYYGKIAFAGTAATMASEALMNPFDTVKQRMQVNSSLKKNSKAFEKNYSSILRTIYHIYSKEGARAFYYSYPTTLMMTVPFHSTNFLVYEMSTGFLNPSNSYNPLAHCVAGGMAGGVASAITTPFDCIKTVLQTHNFTKKIQHTMPPLKVAPALVYDNPLPQSRKLHHSSSAKNINNFFSAANYIYTNRGIGGFTIGMKARVVANIPATAISWTSYEMAKFYLNRKSNAF